MRIEGGISPKEAIGYLVDKNNGKTPVGLKDMILTLERFPDFPLSYFQTISELLLSSNHVPEKQNDYFTTVTLPTLYILHGEHRKGYVDVAGDVLWDLCNLGPQVDSDYLSFLTDKIVEFAGARPQITGQIIAALEAEMKKPYLEKLSLKTIALIGSYARGDAHFYSDVDVLLFAEHGISVGQALENRTLAEFTANLNAQIEEINAYSNGLNNTGGGVFGLKENPKVELLQRVNTASPDFKYLLIGKDEQAKIQVNDILNFSGTS